MGQLLSKGDQDEGLQPANPANSVTISMREINQGTDWNSDESLFKYTSGRWLFNEAKQLAKRSSKFDMNTLARLAAESVGSHICSDVVKLAESDLNKIYLMTTNDGKEVITKVPHTGLSGGIIASEVATMDYVRNVLDLPVPKVHTWSSKGIANTVGTEFIVMEKASGVPLRTVWVRLNQKQRLQVVKAIVRQEKKLMDCTFDAIGSIYYRDQDGTDAATGTMGKGRFSIGPTTEQCFLEDGRSDIQCDRGSWSCTEDFLVAIGLRELGYVKSLKRSPRSHGIFGGGPGWYSPSTAEKINCLEDYIKVAPYLAPGNNSSVSTPVLWHHDLHAGNIFVDPANPTNVTCIIDWQSTHVSPLFMQARHPVFLDFEGPTPTLGTEGDARKPPHLPSDYSELSVEEQEKAKTLMNDQTLYKMYEMYFGIEIPIVAHALMYRETVSYHLINIAILAAHHYEPAMKDLLIRLVDSWEQIAGSHGSPCPIEYSAKDREIHAQQFEEWKNSMALMNAVKTTIGDIPDDWDGAVRHEDFAAVQASVQTVREEILDRLAKDDEARARWSKAWPFKDDDDEGEGE
ncbi:MAG: hypothetical protein Q9186_004215 [Xanthomendoza sp. 1 TL-2023]